MANSGEDKTAGITIDAIVAKDDIDAIQRSVFARWIKTRDCSILPPKELLEKSSCSCQRFEDHEENAVHCPQHHANRIANQNMEEYNRAKPVTNKQQNIKQSNGTTSAHCVSNIGLTSSDQQSALQENLPKTLSTPLRNVKSGDRKSKIPLRIPGSTLLSSLNTKRLNSGSKISKIPVFINKYHPTLLQENVVSDSHVHVRNDENNQQLFNSDDDDDDSIKNDVIPEVIVENNFSAESLSPDKIELEMNFTDPETWKLNVFTEIKEKIQINDSTTDVNKTIMHRQNELKAYYDSFPCIDDLANETCEDIKKAKEFTKSILCELPSGDVDDRITMLHVLSKLLGNENEEFLFYDSKNGINLHNAFLNLADINSQDRPFVLKLHSSEELGNRMNVQTEQDDLELVQLLTHIIEQNGSHPVLEDIIERLSKAHDVDKGSIIIKAVYVGTFNIVYAIKNSQTNAIRNFKEISEKLKNAELKAEEKLRDEFKQFESLKIHPLLWRSSFNVSYFDERGNKAFSDDNKTFSVGPPERTQLYTQAVGWTRYGLKVLGKYKNDDWLHPFQNPKNWYRAFHGTGRAKSEDFGDENQSYDPQYASVDALASIFVNGFQKARKAIHGEGVYCSPNPKFPEDGFVVPVPLDTQKGKKTFKCMLQVAVNPDRVKITENSDVWIVADPTDIRAYGILIKEVDK